jgi:hypothetical protein
LPSRRREFQLFLNRTLTRREFGTALFKAEARLSKHDFISVPQGKAFARALRDWNHGAIPDDSGSMGAPIIEEAEHSPLGIELNVGMSPRNGWVGSVPVVSECHVIFSCEPPIRVDNFRKTTQGVSGTDQSAEKLFSLTV